MQNIVWSYKYHYKIYERKKTKQWCHAADVWILYSFTSISFLSFYHFWLKKPLYLKCKFKKKLNLSVLWAKAHDQTGKIYFKISDLFKLRTWKAVKSLHNYFIYILSNNIFFHPPCSLYHARLGKIALFILVNIV